MEKGHLPYLCQSESPYSSPHFHILIKKIEKQFKINWAQIFLNYFTQLFEINFKHWKGHNFLFNKRVSHVCFWLIIKNYATIENLKCSHIKSNNLNAKKKLSSHVVLLKIQRRDSGGGVKRGPCMCRAKRYVGTCMKG